MNLEPILEIKNISKSYTGHTALDNVSFQIPQGIIFGLLGPNGAGKTSLLRIINRIFPADSGQILISGKPMQQSDLNSIGYLPEERGLYPKMKVIDQLFFLGKLKNVETNKLKDNIYFWLDKLDLSPWKSKKLEELSKGMQQKVQFISTILHEPKLMILDEPFTGFDPKNTELIIQELYKMKEKGVSIVLSTHRMESVDQLCDHIAMIHQSQLALEGELDELKEKYFEEKYAVQLNSKPPIGFEIENFEEKKGKYNFTIKLNSEQKNTFLSRIVEENALLSFSPIKPRMQEIFLKVTQA